MRLFYLWELWLYVDIYLKRLKLLVKWNISAKNPGGITFCLFERKDNFKSRELIQCRVYIIYAEDLWKLIKIPICYLCSSKIYDACPAVQLDYIKRRWGCGRRIIHFFSPLFDLPISFPLRIIYIYIHVETGFVNFFYLWLDHCVMNQPSSEKRETYAFDRVSLSPFFFFTISSLFQFQYPPPSLSLSLLLTIFYS